VSYYDQVNNLVIYNSRSGTPSFCASSAWTPLTAGYAYVLYPRGQGNDGNLSMSFIAEGIATPSVAAALGTDGNVTGTPAICTPRAAAISPELSTLNLERSSDLEHSLRWGY
jgi:hypothetical protein